MTKREKSDVERRIDEWSTPAEIRRHSFDRWASENKVSERVQLDVLHETVEALREELQKATDGGVETRETSA